MNAFGMLFFAAVACTAAIKWWLGARHLAHVGAKRAAVPAEFTGQISLESHQRAADYTRAKTRLGLISLALEVVVLLALTFGGGLQWLRDVAASALPAGIPRGLVLIVLVGLVMTLVELPISLYSTFRVEARFGFNKMTPALFWKDFFKGLLLAAALGLPLAAVVLWLMEKSGAYWWLYAWLVWMGFNILLLAIYPTWIAPLFNKFTPMDNAALKERIEALLTRCGFKVKGLVVMDGSLRSSHGNAYFTGFGKSKRIVFFDTLIERLNPAEVEAVLAHELGHFKRRHVIKRIVWTFAASFFFLWLLGYLMQQPWFYQGLNVATASPAMALILFFLVIPNFTFLLQPVLAMYSRKHEFEADQYAAQNASAGDLISALVKLYKDNASTLTPDPLHSMFYDSHPPALARIGRLQAQT
ncbi:MAG TPA: M48 family metallopeptidase [Burkholderiales bacterium]|nr:M48 family metallopeptidase [Burkholderiales bacterium]